MLATEWLEPNLLAAKRDCLERRTGTRVASRRSMCAAVSRHAPSLVVHCLTG